MHVKEVMTNQVRLTTPEQPISEAAKLMAESDTGSIPVRDRDRLVGMLTDRDIAVRAVARHLSPETRVREVMSREVLYCFEDEDCDGVAENMGKNQVRRLPVLNREKRLVGIVSLADVLRGAKPQTAANALKNITKRGGAHSGQH